MVIYESTKYVLFGKKMDAKCIDVEGFVRHAVDQKSAPFEAECQ